MGDKIETVRNRQDLIYRLACLAAWAESYRIGEYEVAFRCYDLIARLLDQDRPSAPTADSAPEPGDGR